MSVELLAIFLYSSAENIIICRQSGHGAMQANTTAAGKKKNQSEKNEKKLFFQLTPLFDVFDRDP